MLQTKMMFHLAGAAKQPSTWRQYEPVWRKWEAFCHTLGLHADRSDPQTARLFLSEQIEEARAAPTPKGPGVIEQCSAGLSAYFTTRGQPSPCTEDFLCSQLRKAAKNLLTGQQRQREDATLGDVLAIISHFLTPACSLRDRMMCTAIALQFYAMWRFEQLACVLVHEAYLRLTDTSAAFMIWHDKTDTSSAGKWKELPAVGGPACPVRLKRELLPAVAAACAIWGQRARRYSSRTLGPCCGT